MSVKGSRVDMRARYRPVIARAAAVALLAGSVSCGDVVRQGKAPVLVVFDSMEAASGAEPGNMSSFLLSDVSTVVDDNAVIFNDVAQATMRLIPKDAGNGAATLAPSAWNSVTINRYHITFF